MRNNVGAGEGGSCPVTVPVMENIDLLEQIDRCERLAKALTDEEMRMALQNLAEDYKAQLRRREPFMLNGSAR